MNVLLQRHCARYIYVVPEGLKELMSDISREVIRCDPENIYTFIADYLDALLITRENARVAARLVQSITDIATTTVEFLLNTGMNRPEADNVVNILEKTFRQCIQTSYAGTEGTEPDEVEEINIISDIINEADIPPEIGEQAATIIQNAYRKFKIRRDKERELLSGMVDWRVAARSAIRLYRKTGVTYEEANRAATLIKAAYKGYYTRRVMRKLAEESKLLADAIDEEEIEEEEISEHEYLYSQKIVKIDYGTIIPHVDFDEPKVAEVGSTDTSVSTPEAESTTSTVVYSVAEEILNLTLQEIKKREDVDVDVKRSWLDEFFESKSEDFSRRGIKKLFERWEEVINNYGEYITD
ncbi:uncharacterized protein LOC108915219 [Anoplophora glabripennis]|uniref:uncharacterized protein LOC108915219 n=1 Tax=Anoplophora glabripennis TaxID=217634 RepID=UPI0008748C3E|nr:uncharacterized protein LOC108915219 [Anoplophora glabripennis]